MMKVNILGVVGLLASLCACGPTQKPQAYTVTGEAYDSTMEGKVVYLMRCDDEKILDSTQIEGMNFVFTGQVDTAAMCRVVVKDTRRFAYIILEGGDIKANMQGYNRPSGTKQNDEMARISAAQDSIYGLAGQAWKDYRAKYTDQKELEAQWKTYIEGFQKTLAEAYKQFYAGHTDDAVGYFLLESVGMNLDWKVQKELVAELGPWLKSTQRAQKMIARIEALEKTAEGKPFVDIKGQDADGKAVSLSDYIGKGNYVLMDMWASWCGPCRGEIPNLAKLHNQFKDKGLTVLGLFVWDKVENLKPALESERVTWPQIIDTDEMAGKLYGVTGIPHIILFAPDGTILKRNLRGEGMVQMVTETMTKK